MTLPRPSCPRCGDAHIECHHEACDGDSLMWQILHCESCSFTWRTSEEPHVREYDRRPTDHRLDAAALENLRNVP